MERQFSERQLIRWAVPGWITLFLVILLAFVHFWFYKGFHSSVWSVLQRPPNGTIEGGTIAAGGAAIIALGFALGFTLFQVYFVMYWCDWKFWKFPSLAALVGGGVNYREVVDSLERFSSTLKKEFGHWPTEANTGGTERQRMEASSVAAWWRAISQNKEQRMVWENRNEYLVSVYHSLGAMLVGSYLIVLVYVFAVIVPSLVRGEWAALSLPWLPLLINLAVLGAWICVLWRGRTNTEFFHRNLSKHALYYFYQQEREESDGKRTKRTHKEKT